MMLSQGSITLFMRVHLNLQLTHFHINFLIASFFDPHSFLKLKIFNHLFLIIFHVHIYNGLKQSLLEILNMIFESIMGKNEEHNRKKFRIFFGQIFIQIYLVYIDLLTYTLAALYCSKQSIANGLKKYFNPPFIYTMPVDCLAHYSIIDGITYLQL